MGPFAHRSGLDSRDAFALFYERTAPELLVWFARRVLEPDLALELTAETYARAFKSRRRFRGSTDSEAFAWLYAIAKRQLADYFRKGAAETRVAQALQVRMPQLSEEEFERVEELADLADRRREVSTALSTLSQDKRKALELRIVDELPYPLVAERLGITEVAARARVSRGLKALTFALNIDPKTEESLP